MGSEVFRTSLPGGLSPHRSTSTSLEEDKPFGAREARTSDPGPGAGELAFHALAPAPQHADEGGADLSAALVLRPRVAGPVDSCLDIFCADGDIPYHQADVRKTLAAGYTPRDKVQVALDAMKPYGITGLGLVNVDL